MRVAVCWRKPLSQTLDEWMKTKCFSNIWHFEYGALPFCKAHISLHGFTKHHKIGSRVCAWGFVMDWAEIQKNACMIQAPFFPSPQILIDTGLALLAWMCYGCYGIPQQPVRLSAYVRFKSPKTVIRDHDWNWRMCFHMTLPPHTQRAPQKLDSQSLHLIHICNKCSTLYINYFKR